MRSALMGYGHERCIRQHISPLLLLVTIVVALITPANAVPLMAQLGNSTFPHHILASRLRVQPRQEGAGPAAAPQHRPAERKTTVTVLVTLLVIAIVFGLALTVMFCKRGRGGGMASSGGGGGSGGIRGLAGKEKMALESSSCVFEENGREKEKEKGRAEKRHRERSKSKTRRSGTAGRRARQGGEGGHGHRGSRAAHGSTRVGRSSYRHRERDRRRHGQQLSLQDLNSFDPELWSTVDFGGTAGVGESETVYDVDDDLDDMDQVELDSEVGGVGGGVYTAEVTTIRHAGRGSVTVIDTGSTSVLNLIPSSNVFPATTTNDGSSSGYPHSGNNSANTLLLHPFFGRARGAGAGASRPRSRSRSTSRMGRGRSFSRSRSTVRMNGNFSRSSSVLPHHPPVLPMPVLPMPLPQVFVSPEQMHTIPSPFRRPRAPSPAPTPPTDADTHVLAVPGGGGGDITSGDTASEATTIVPLPPTTPDLPRYEEHGRHIRIPDSQVQRLTASPDGGTIHIDHLVPGPPPPSLMQTPPSPPQPPPPEGSPPQRPRTAHTRGGSTSGPLTTSPIDLPITSGSRRSSRRHHRDRERERERERERDRERDSTTNGATPPPASPSPSQTTPRHSRRPRIRGSEVRAEVARIESPAPPEYCFDLRMDPGSAVAVAAGPGSEREGRRDRERDRESGTGTGTGTGNGRRGRRIG